MNKSLVKTISNEINLYVLGLISIDKLNSITAYIEKNPFILLETNELVSKKVNYMLQEREDGNNYGSSTECNIYKSNVSKYENLLTVFLEIPELKKQAIELLSNPLVFEIIFNAAIEQKNKDMAYDYFPISYSKFKMLEKIEDVRNSGEIEEVLNYAPQHAIKFILNNYKSFDKEIIGQILSLKMETVKEVLSYLSLNEIEEIKNFPKVILNELKQNNVCLNTKSLKMK